MGFGGGRHRLGTLFGNVSSFATEQAEVLLETALSLCLRELAVFPSFEERLELGFFWLVLLLPALALLELLELLFPPLLFLFLSAF